MATPFFANPLVWAWSAIALGSLALALGLIVAFAALVTPLFVKELRLLVERLPASAALLVALRHLRQAYLAGPLYNGPQ